MTPRIITLSEKKLVGMRMSMSFSANKTGDLWRSFMLRRKEISNNIGTDLYSIQVYTPGFFNNFNPSATFEKWAAVEAASFDTIPDGMEAFTLPGGLYAVFDYKGASSAAGPTFQYIHSTWLPNSQFTLDTRPHFEIIGPKYKNEDPDSEEELWIPVKQRQ